MTYHIRPLTHIHVTLQYGQWQTAAACSIIQSWPCNFRRVPDIENSELYKLNPLFPALVHPLPLCNQPYHSFHIAVYQDRPMFLIAYGWLLGNKLQTPILQEYARTHTHTRARARAHTHTHTHTHTETCTRDVQI